MRPEHTKNLSLFVAVLLTCLVLFVALRSYTIYKSASRLNPLSNFELDPLARATADSLEDTMNRLSDYVFEIESDPLRLSRVVVTKEEMEFQRARETEEELLVRLSATVVDEEPKAVIKCKDRSYIVGIGDSLAGKYLVTEISHKKATLVADGKEIFLETKPLSEEGRLEPALSEDSVAFQKRDWEEF